MPSVPDKDRFFSGSIDAATPPHLLEEGKLVRLLNARFENGSVTNAIGFDEIPLHFPQGGNTRIFAKKYTYQALIDRGDIQLLAPLNNLFYEFLLTVVNGRLLMIDPEDGSVNDITPRDSFLPNSSYQNRLTFIGNEGGVSGVGGTTVILNDLNRPIFATIDRVRISSEVNMEMPPMRLAESAGNRVFSISGSNTLWGSDAIGQTPGAPLTYSDTLTPSTGYYGDTFVIGSFLDGEYITSMCRLPKYLGPSEEFYAHSLYVFSEKHRFIVAAEAARAVWKQEGYNFILYAGAAEGGAGPLARTVAGDTIVYEDTRGRIKQIIQDQTRNTGLQEVFFDAPLGQYADIDAVNFGFKSWYQLLNHSRAVVNYYSSRIFATVYPTMVPCINSNGDADYAPSNKALAVASMASDTRLGGVASPVWEGFYDWLQPSQCVVSKDNFFVFSKDFYGRNRLFKMNHQKRDDHRSVIYTRAYFAQVDGGSDRTLSKGELFFLEIGKNTKVKISYLANNEWIPVQDCMRAKRNIVKFTVRSAISSSYGIPLRIEICHEGERFLLQSVRVTGETLTGN